MSIIDELTPAERVVFETKTLVLFYQELFPEWSFPKHLIPVAQGLCDKRIDKLQIQIGPGAGKSQLLSCVFPTYTLGRDPKQTILGISGAEKLIQKFQKTSMGFIEYHKAFHKFFPDVKPDKREGWSLEAGAYLNLRNRSLPDPNWFVAGINSAAVVGAHASIIILDDIHNDENSSSEKQCDQIVNLYFNTVLGRAQSTGARFVLAGRRWRENDLYGVLEKAGDWVTMVLPAERKDSERLWIDVTVPEGIECVFTEQYECVRTDPVKKLRYYRADYGVDQLKQGFFWPEMPAKRKEYQAVKRTRPAVAESVYQCRPGSREGGVFFPQDFRYVPSVPTLQEINTQGGYIAQAWDTASDVHADSDYSVGITGVFIPCQSYHNNESKEAYGEVDAHLDVIILDVVRKKLKFGDLVSEVRRNFQIWRPQKIIVEKKSSGIQIVQSLSALGVPIEGVNPGSEGKRARATGMSKNSGTGSVQGWFRLGRVFFPQDAPWLASMEQELVDFTGDGSGHDDQVDALVYLIATAIKMGSGFSIMPSDTEAVLGMQATDCKSPFSELELLLKQSADPFGHSCGRCVNLDMGSVCALHQRRVTALEICGDFESSDQEGLRWMV